ncbi:MAG: hypothetical protein AAF614_36955 [Chloroflexota bacterium]
MKGRFLAIFLALLAVALVTIQVAFAHQPFFEDRDFTAVSPHPIADADISTAVYATLDSRTDVDYYTFRADAGQVVQLEMTIPQIEEQAEFAPTMAVMGEGLASVSLPSQIKSSYASGQLIPPTPAEPFFEPFSGTSYWDRQEIRLTMPTTGEYTVAVWHESGEVGRYVFVIGTQEIRGGDPDFRSKIDDYWTAVPEPVEAIAPAEESTDTHYSCPLARSKGN